MRKWFLSCFMKSLQCIWPIHEKVSNFIMGSTIKKNCSTTEEHFVNLLDDQDKSKFFVWIENNFGNHEVEDIGSPDCCAKSNFGTKIQASCKKAYMDELASKVPVGEWINIDNFSLTGAVHTYRTTKNPLKINFLHNTDISESTLRIENNFLDLVDFETILSGKPDPNILIDVIGQVLDLGDLDTVHCAGGKQRKKLEFTLRDIKEHMLRMSTQLAKNLKKGYLYAF
ncbi:hypothetical protein Bca4012_005504 [Brassica carinata]